MVEALRARPFEDDTGQLDDYSSPRPAKRRRVHSEPADRDAVYNDPKTDALTGPHVLGQLDHTYITITAHHPRISTKTARFRVPSESPTVSRPPSLCRSGPSTPEDDICRLRDTQSESPWKETISDPRSRSYSAGNVRDAQKQVHVRCDKEPCDAQHLTGHDNFLKKQYTVNVQDGLPHWPSTPMREGKAHAEDERSDHKSQEQEALQVSAETATDAGSCGPVHRLGPAVSPPTAPCTPPEYVYEHFPNPDFSRELQLAFQKSNLVAAGRRYRYGAEVSERWKHGFTPEEDRERWASIAAEHQADAEAYSPD